MKLTRYILLLLFALMASAKAIAQVDIVRPNMGSKTKIAPAYFGPLAFPVPDMLDGRTSSGLRVELYGDCFLGTTTSSVTDDITADIFARLTIPLFTPKVNLTVWMPIVEYYYSTPEVNAYRRVSHEGVLRGVQSGDVYVSIDVRLLSQERHHLDITARAVLKTASANDFAQARCYDSPGYYFDVAFGRELLPKNKDNDFRVAVSSGLLCWQTDNGRQNDAIMYGLKLAYRHKSFMIDTTFGGYYGWERYGDAPMTLKTNLSYRLGDLTLNLAHQVGFKDWPFHQIRVGATYTFDILSKLNR